MINELYDLLVKEGYDPKTDATVEPSSIDKIQVFFPNGYGASVVCGYGTYGYDEGLLELAVIKGAEEGWDLAYDTPITDDVIGYLNAEEALEIIKKIEKLNEIPEEELNEYQNLRG